MTASVAAQRAGCPPAPMLRGEATMFGNLGFGELMIIMVIVLVLFGAKRVPEISASFGKGIREFKKNLNDVESAVTGAVIPGRVDAPQDPYPRPVQRDQDETRAEPKRLL